MSRGFRFDRFTLDPADRLLRRDGVPIELNARYLDALVLLVRAEGRLVSKEEFLEKVWRGVPVTDEALTQCIKTLRRQLGDNAAAPQFIETVPKHGYRFVAAVEEELGQPVSPIRLPSRSAWHSFLVIGAAGTIGGGVAGILGGLFYGFSGASQPLQSGMGAISVLLVLVCLNILVGLMAGAGVGFGIAGAGFTPGRLRGWTVIGGALGGLAVGAFVKLFGIDAFSLLLGQAPGDITGPAEGAVLGGAIGFAVWLARRNGQFARGILAGGIAGAMAGILIPLLGGRLMGGSLAQLAQNFPESRLQIVRMGGLFGETGFGHVSQMVTAGIEGMLFGGCIVGALLIARRSLEKNMGARP